jgi:hypothetical protein
MATDRHDNNGSAVDAGASLADGEARPARPILRPVTGDRPVPEERRSRSELYSDLRHTGAGGDQGPRSSPDGPRMTDDGVWEWKGLRLEAQANHIADEELSARRTAEGREDDGSYGDRGITPAMRRVEARLEHGTLVPDTEKFALKSPDRFKEKLAKMIAIEPDRPSSDLSREIHDGIRYTFLFDSEHYSTGVEAACSELGRNNHILIGFKPGWAGEEYKGINSQWKDTASGQLFEVQFHTPDSWEAKQKTHDAYERIESPETPVAERLRLRDYQREISARVTVPPDVLEFSPYKNKEG